MDTKNTIMTVNKKDVPFTYDCEYCGKEYIHSQGRSKHYNMCRAKAEYETYGDEQLVAYGDEDESAITDDQILDILQKTPGESVIIEVVKLIWNEPKHMNIKVDGRFRKKVAYFDGSKWVQIDKGLFADQIIRRVGTLISDRKSENHDIGRACVYLPNNRKNYKDYINILETDPVEKSSRKGRPERLREMQDAIVKYFSNIKFRFSTPL